MARSNTGDEANWLDVAAPITAPPFTMACWVNLADETAFYNLMALSMLVADNEYHTLVAAGDVANDPLQAISQDGGGERIATSTGAGGYAANTWFHACGVWASSTSRTVYRDGANNATNTGSATPTIDTLSVAAGRFASATWSAISGSIAHAAIWNVALTAAEVLMLSKGFAPPCVRPDALLNYWPLTGRMASPEQDRWGNSHLAINGTMVQAADPPRIFLPTGMRAGVASSGGTTTSPTPVTATGTVVGVSLAIAHALAAVSMTGTLVAPTQGIVASLTPIEVLGTVVAPTPSFANAPAAVSITGTAVTQDTALGASLSPIESPATAVAPTTGMGVALDPVSVSGAVVGVTEAFGADLPAVAASGTVVAAATSLGADLSAVAATTDVATASTALGASPSPVSITVTVVAVGASIPDDVNVALDAVAMTAAMPAASQALGASPTPVVLTASVVTASASTSAAPAISAIILSSAQFAYARSGQEQFGYVRLYGAKFVYVVQTDARFSE